MLKIQAKIVAACKIKFLDVVFSLTKIDLNSLLSRTHTVLDAHFRIRRNLFSKQNAIWTIYLLLYTDCLVYISGFHVSN